MYCHECGAQVGLASADAGAVVAEGAGGREAVLCPTCAAGDDPDPSTPQPCAPGGPGA